MINLQFEVIRHRQSVTQGTAEVLCNSQSIVIYGDDIYLNGKDPWGFEKTVHPMFGDIIAGYGSIKSDEHFITGALRQYTDKIIKIIGEV